MNKYPKVNYIGNKEKIANWIIDCFPTKDGIVLDLFSGGCSLSYAMKKKGFKVITNDVLYSNYCISRAIIENSKEKLVLNIDEESIYKYFDENIHKLIQWMINKLYFEDEVRELACLISYSKTLKGSKKYLFLSLLRRAMIRKIPYSRMNIKWEEIIKLRDEEYSYKKYKRRRAYHNKSFTYHILENIDAYNSSVFCNEKKNKSYQKDAFDLLKKLNNQIDIIYIDPPYPSTMNNYSAFYGAFDQIFNKNIDYVDFTDKTSFITNIRKLVKLSKNKTKYLAISLNNKSKPSYSDIIDQVKDLVSSVKIYKREHVYKVTGKDNKKANYEVLLLFKV